MSITPAQTLGFYPKASESVFEVDAEPSKYLVVQDVINHSDPTHLANLEHDSIVYRGDHKAYKARESIVWNGTWRVPFNSLAVPLNGVSATILSSAGVMKELSIHIKIPSLQTATGGFTTPATGHVQLTDGWGYQLINRVEITVAGRVIQWYGYQIVQMLYHYCKSQAQFDALMKIGGAGRSSPATNADYVVWQTNPIDAICMLPVPWSMPGMPALDCSMLMANQMQVTVYLNSFNTIVGGNGTTGGAVVPALFNISAAYRALTGLTSGTFMARTGYFLNPTMDSIQSELLYHQGLTIGGGGLAYSPLFDRYISYSVPSALYSAVGTARTLVNLQGLDMSKSLLGIAVGLVATRDLLYDSTLTPGGGIVGDSSVNALNYQPMYDIQVTNQGRDLYLLQDEEFELTRVMLNDQGAQFVNPTLYGAIVNPAYPSTAVSPVGYVAPRKLYRFMFTEKDKDWIKENGAGLGIQSLQLSFTVDTNLSTSGASIPLTLLVSYLYNGALSFSANEVMLI